MSSELEHRSIFSPYYQYKTT